MTRRTPFVTMALAIGFAATLFGMATAAPIVKQSYTSDKLATLWQGTLGSAAPEVSRFALLAPGGSAPPPVATVPAANLGLPFAGMILGESATPTGAVQVRAFPVAPMSREDASVLNRRLAWAEIYLARYRYFEAVSTDGAEVMTALTERQYAAALEAYLITARLYYAAPDFPGKCAHLTRLTQIVAGPLSGISPQSLPQGWRDLLPVQTAAAARLQADALAGLVCAVEPVRGRAETVRLVETRVREKVMVAVRAQVTATLTLLDAAAARFTDLVNRMDVLILSAEILELERVLGNSAANMILVKEDQLRAGETVAQLQAIDLSMLNQPTALAEYQTGQARMQAMTALIDEVMAALADLPGAVTDPQSAADLAPCIALRGAYAALDLAQDSGTLSAAISAPYEDCLARARSVVLRFQEPSLDKALMAALAGHVRQISETYLATVNP